MIKTNHMRIALTRSLIAFAISACSVTACYSQDAAPTVQKVVLIRHGEKPDKGDNLSCKGLNRSIQLPAVLNKLGTINSIFVPSLGEGKSTSHSRMFQTATPYAVQHNMDINTKYKESDPAGVATAIKKQAGTVLVIWEHNNIPAIAKALGVTENLAWEKDDYDSLWIITFKNGHATLTRDKENLNPENNCR
jgi:hypothetical protein